MGWGSLLLASLGFQASLEKATLRWALLVHKRALSSPPAPQGTVPMVSVYSLLFPGALALGINE